MMKIIQKSKKAISEGGVSLLWKRSRNFLYDQYSQFLPWIKRDYNGITVPSHKPTGRFIPAVDVKDKPNYEEGIISSLEREVEEGDNIVICGGGLGVTAVKSALLNEDPSKVEIFEGSRSQIENIEKTLRENEVSEINLRHAIVGNEKEIWGSTGEADRISAEDLPLCDILELDIEGSEKGVLKELGISPNTIIVESHGHLDAPTDEIKSILRVKGYEIKNVELAEDSEHAEKNDIRVITAKN